MNGKLAHSPSPSGRQDPLAEHLTSVAERASEFALAFDADQEARVAGLAHDFGKYGPPFIERLRGKATKVDHWSVGAWVVLQLLKKEGIAAALAIQGHHIGLQQATASALRELDPQRLAKEHPLGLQLSDPDVEALLLEFSSDGLQVPTLDRSIYEWSAGRNLTDMLDVRMLFSALVDADFLETEAHFQAMTSDAKNYRQRGPNLEPFKALAVLLAHIERLVQGSFAAQAVDALRADLLSSCLEAGNQDPGLFTITAPTGAGKTLSMMAFALKHAAQHNLRRVIVVIPYLSIIDQSVKAYREAFGEMGDTSWLRRYVLEHHSLAGLRRIDDSSLIAKDAAVNQERLLAENWDAPIVVTTSVQFLESLFANRPAACRKLHRLAGSVIMFDEVQTLPLRLIVPTLGTLSRLSERYGASVVFSTATQPAFDHLHPVISKALGQGWQPVEIVPKGLNLFERARRTAVAWPQPGARMSWDQLAARVASFAQVLCIVNLKRHALHLTNLLADGSTVFHLSTNMCPAHRDKVLDEVRRRLRDGEPCRLVSTQCIEAGVDVDFPKVLRAWGPLEGIAQAAGRCNRNGRQVEGQVEVFVPDDAGRLYPDGAYERAAKVTEALLRELGDQALDINDEELYRRYYEMLYNLAAPETLCREILEAGKLQHFPEVSRLYRLIDTDAINVLVPYDLDAYHALAAEVRDTGLTARWITRARAHAISVFRPRRDDPLRDWLEPVHIGTGRTIAHDWFIYLNEAHYNSVSGLCPPESMDCLIA